MFFVREAGKRRLHGRQTLPLERWLDFLPLDRIEPEPWALGEGNTPFVRLNKLAAGRRVAGRSCQVRGPESDRRASRTGAPPPRSRRPSLSGFKRIGTVSTGNMAASTAAYGARAGLDTTVLLKEETSPQALLAAGIFGPRLVRVRGDYGSLFFRSLEIGRKLGIYFMNSVDPVRIEGYKVTAFEIFLQSGRKAPGTIFVPVSSGGHFIGLMRGFEDLLAEGLIDDIRRSSVSRRKAALRWPGRLPPGSTDTSGSTRPIPSPTPSRIPPRRPGTRPCAWCASTTGMIVAVSDTEILEAQRALAAREGLFCQPESAVTWAALLRLAEPREARPRISRRARPDRERAQSAQGPRIAAHPGRRTSSLEGSGRLPGPAREALIPPGRPSDRRGPQAPAIRLPRRGPSIVSDPGVLR